MKTRVSWILAVALLTGLAQAFGGTVCTTGSGCVITVDWALDVNPDSSTQTCGLTRSPFFPAGDGLCTLRRAIREAGARENDANNRPILIEFTGLNGTNMDADDVQYDAVNDQWTIPIGSSTAIDHWKLKPFSITDKTGNVTIRGLPLHASGLPKILIEGEKVLEVEMTGNTIEFIGMFGGTGVHFKEPGNTFQNNMWGLTADGQSIAFTDKSGDPDNLAGKQGVLVLIGAHDSTVQNSVFAGASTKAIEVANSAVMGFQFLNNWIGTRIDGTVPAVEPGVECETQPPGVFTANDNDWYGGWGISATGIGGTIQGNVIAALQNIRSTNDTPPGALEIFGSDHLVTQNTIGRDALGSVVGVCGQGVKFSGIDHTVTENIINQARKGFENTKGAILWSDDTALTPGFDGGTTLQGNLVIDGAELDTFERYFEMGPKIGTSIKLFEPGEITSINGTSVTGSAAAGSPCPNCVIDFYRDDLDANEEGLEYLGSTNAIGDGSFSHTLAASIAAGFGIRTTSTTMADNVIPGTFAGTTSEISDMVIIECPTVLNLMDETLSGVQMREAIQKITTHNVTFSSGSNVMLTAGESIEVGDLTTIESSSTVTFIIDPSADCIP